MKKSSGFVEVKNYIAALLFSAAAGAAIFYVMRQTGAYLLGNGVYAQLFRLDLVADGMQEGSWWPLYSQSWYNGYEAFRYTFPLSYLLIHGLMQLFSADVHMGISAFYGIMASLAMLGFCLFGIRFHRMTAAAVTGVAYCLLPTTAVFAVFRCSFDLTMAAALLPMVLFFLFDFIKWKRRLALLPLTLIFAALVLAHFLLAFVMGIVICIYLLVHAVILHEWRFEAAAAGDLLLSGLLMGHFLFPALSGGLLAKDCMRQVGDMPEIGMAVMVLAFLGVLMADRKRMADFLVQAFLFLFSLAPFAPVLRLMPCRALQDGFLYELAAAAFLLTAFLCWERLRLVFLIVFLGAMIGRNAAELRMLPDGKDALLQSRRVIQEHLLDEAAAMTDNRLALIDQAALGDLPYWYFAGQDVRTLGGWDYDNAWMMRSQDHINEAFADGFYGYVFDRLLLYGNDVAVIEKALLTEEGAYENLLYAAEENGYEVKAENEKTIVLKAAGVDSSFGVVSAYTNLALGEDASVIAYLYPSFGLGRSSCLEDYTVEELSAYQRLYLAGFTYREKEKAENMLRELAEKGVQIYIDMQHIPVNQLTGKNEFLGVYAQFVQFTEDFPVLKNDNGNQFKLAFQTPGYETWNTVYVSGCREVLKETSYGQNRHLTYVGRNQEKNITFMGFNLVYYYLSTHNKDLKRFLDETMGLSEEPVRETMIVPVSVERQKMQLVVHSEEDGVNCNIASVDTLLPDRMIGSEENMWVVNRGDTVFTLARPRQAEGSFCSVLGGIGILLLWIMVYVVLEVPTRDKEKTEELS